MSTSLRTPKPQPQPPSAAQGEALLTLRGACVRFGALTALHGVDLQLHRGDRLALVGANGSGKTTLLRLLHGLQPCEGVRQVHALQSASGSPSQPGRLPVATMLFQRPFLLHLSVQRNLSVALWLGGVPRAERAERTAEALARVGLAHCAQQSARALSGGQQQRLALARAWALRPDILFLDEPTASLDPSAKREVEALIHDFAASGMTLVMSTHNLGQVKRLASRVAYLEAGRLVVDRPVASFFDEALPDEAAQFLRGELPWA